MFTIYPVNLSDALRVVVKKMTSRAFIQFLIILIGVIFEAMGTGYGMATMFPLSEEEVSVRGYVYYVCEHLKFIALVLLMWLSPAQARDFKTDRVFVILAVLDFIDYLAFGNNVYYKIGAQPMLPISMNVFAIAFFFFYAHKQWKMNGEQF